MLTTFFQIFIIAFLINLLYEVLHSQLYTTCLKMPLKKYIPLITIASVKDGIWISIFFAVSVLIFKNLIILTNYYQILFFIIIALTFAFIDEKISIKYKRWEYSSQMPKIFGVGITPLLELAITGM